MSSKNKTYDLEFKKVLSSTGKTIMMRLLSAWARSSVFMKQPSAAV